MYFAYVFFYYLTDVLICCQYAVSDLITDLGIKCDHKL